MRWLALGAAGLVLAAACTSSPPSTTGAATTINFWYLSSGAHPDQQFQAAARAFHTVHPDIEVKGTMLTAADAYAKMLAALTSGSGPDVMQVNAGWVGAFAATGALHEFTADEVQRLGGKDAFVPAAWNTSGAYQSGKTTAIPWFIDTKALYYRKDILQRVASGPGLAPQLHGNFGVAPFPPGESGQVVYAGGSNLSILKTTRHEGAATEWVDWLAGLQGQTTYVAQLGMYPALAAAADSSIFAGNQYFAPFKSQIGKARSFPTIPAWPRVESALEPYFVQIWETVIHDHEPMPSDKEAALLDKAAKDMQAAIQQPS